MNQWVERTDDLYHSDTTRASASGLKLIMSKSPFHFYKQYVTRETQKDSDALRFGRLAHKLLLEPSTVRGKIAVRPKFDRRTKNGKDGYELFELENAGKIILDESDAADIIGISDTILGSPKASALFSGGVAEKTAFFVYNEGGLEIPCRARMDYVRPDHIIVDLKTTTDCTPGSFVWDAKRYLYDIQAAMYCYAYQKIEGRTPDFYIVAAEKAAPYAIASYQLRQFDIDAAMDRLHGAMIKYDECMRSGVWPMPTTEIQWLEL